MQNNQTQFKQTEIGLIPEDWEVLELGKVCEITSSKRIFASDYKIEGIPFYRGKEIIEKGNGSEISTELFITEEKFNEIKNKFGAPKEGDLLLSSVGTLGVPYLVDKNETFYFKDGNLTWFRNWNREVCPKFIYYWIKSSIGRERIIGSSIGSTQSALTIVNLKNIQVKLPSLIKQQKIAEVLWTLDEKIELLRKMNKTLESLGQAIFKEWFIDNKNYKVGKFSDIAEVTTGKRPEVRSNEKTPELSIPLIGAGSVMGYTANALYKNKDIIVTGRVGTHGVLQRINEPCWPSDNTLVTCSGIQNFVYQTMKTLDFHSLNKGSTQPLITQTDLKNFQINIPSDTEIKKYEQVTQPMTDIIFSNKKQIETLSQIRDSLLPKLISGKLRTV